MPVLFELLVVPRTPISGHVATKRVQPMLDTHLDFVEGRLNARPWFAGDQISAADIMMSFSLEAAHVLRKLGEGRPAITEWLGRIHARPAYIKALEKGGPYAFAS